jgi:hypothetical protein
MEIHKTHSKNDIIDIINLLGLPVVFSHQDNKKDLQQKIRDLMEKEFEVKTNYYNIQNKQDLIKFFKKKNPKKILSIKQKRDVMDICKCIVNYCKNNYRLDLSVKYDTIQDIIDDLDYVKQFGEIPSVRRACRLMNGDPKVNGLRFNPVIPPNIQKVLDDKAQHSKGLFYHVTIRRSTPEEPIIVYFE